MIETLQDAIAPVRTQLQRTSILRKSGPEGEAKGGLFESIEGYYNPVRLHSALGHLTPETAM